LKILNYAVRAGGIPIGLIGFALGYGRLLLVGALSRAIARKVGPTFIWTSLSIS
jgi:hypothetical protein